MEKKLKQIKRLTNITRKDRSADPAGISRELDELESNLELRDQEIDERLTVEVQALNNRDDVLEDRLCTLNDKKADREELETIVLTPGPKGEDGKDGAPGINGKDGRDGLDGRDGINGKDGIDGLDGKDGSPDTPKDIKTKLESLKGKDRLKKDAIQGLDEIEQQIQIIGARPSVFPGNSGLESVNGYQGVPRLNFTGATVTRTGNVVNVAVNSTTPDLSSYLKLDQTTQQHVINNAPYFDQGIIAGDSILDTTGLHGCGMGCDLNIENIDGTLKLTADYLIIDGSAGEGTTILGYLESPVFTSTATTGTAPLGISSTTLVTNLNADLWDGYQFSDYLDQAVKTTSSPSFTGVTLTSGILTGKSSESIEIGVTDDMIDFKGGAGSTNQTIRFDLDGTEGPEITAPLSTYKTVILRDNLKIYGDNLMANGEIVVIDSNFDLSSGTNKTCLQAYADSGTYGNKAMYGLSFNCRLSDSSGGRVQSTGAVGFGGLIYVSGSNQITGSLTGGTTDVQINSSASVSNLFSSMFRPIYVYNNMTPTVTSATGLRIQAGRIQDATITSYGRGVWIEAWTKNNGSIPTLTSIHLDKQTIATTNWQIYSVGGNLYFGAGNIATDTTTGLSLGNATNQKISFYGVTPIVQPTTSIAEAAFTENAGGTAVNVDSTFGGYTIQQVVKALQNLGALA